jgi:hypothetical protein
MTTATEHAPNEVSAGTMTPEQGSDIGKAHPAVLRIINEIEAGCAAGDRLALIVRKQVLDYIDRLWGDGEHALPLPPNDGEWHVMHLPPDVAFYHLRSLDVILLQRR